MTVRATTPPAKLKSGPSRDRTKVAERTLAPREDTVITKSNIE